MNDFTRSSMELYPWIVYTTSGGGYGVLHANGLYDTGPRLSAAEAYAHAEEQKAAAERLEIKED